MAPMTAATPAQVRAFTELREAHQRVRETIDFLEIARDALNRQEPAREVAIAITEAEGAELRVGKALAVLTSSVYFGPDDDLEPATVTGRELGGFGVNDHGDDGGHRPAGDDPRGARRPATSRAEWEELMRRAATPIGGPE